MSDIPEPLEEEAEMMTQQFEETDEKSPDVVELGHDDMTISEFVGIAEGPHVNETVDNEISEVEDEENLPLSKADWVPYTGPQGGEGWQNVETEEVVYEDTPPGANEGLEEFFDADIGELLDGLEEAFGQSIREDVEQQLEELGAEDANDVRQFLQEEASPEDFGQVVQAVTGEALGEDNVESAVEGMSEEELEPSEFDFSEEVAEEGDIVVTEGEGAYEGETIYGQVVDMEAGHRGDDVEVEWALPDGVSRDTHRPYSLDAQIVEGSAPETPDREDYAEHLNQIEDLEPLFQLDRDSDRKEVLFEDGRKGQIFRVDTYEDEVQVRFYNEDGSIRDTKTIPLEEAEEEIVAEVYEDADPEDFERENTIATARIAAVGGMDPIGAPNYDWNEVSEVFSQADDEVLSDAVKSAVLYKNDADNSTVTNSNFETEELWHLDYEQGEGVSQIGSAQPRNLGIMMTHMDGESVVETVEETLDEIDEVYPEETERQYSDDTFDPRPDAREAVVAAGVLFSPDNKAREKLLEEHGEHVEDMHGSKREALNMLTADDFDNWRSSWIDGWAQKGGNPPAVLTQYALDDFGPNEENNSLAWTGGRPYGDIAIPDTMREHMEQLYENTQEQLEGETVSLYRGVRGNVTTNSNLESWSELKSIADKFDDYILEAEVDAEDVFATWETLGEDWPEEQVKGKREWMVLGGAL